MTNIGKPYEGKPHVRFDEEGLGPAQPFTLACGFLLGWRRVASSLTAKVQLIFGETGYFSV